MQEVVDQVLQALMLSTMNACDECGMSDNAMRVVLDPLITRYEDLLNQQLQGSDVFGHVESGTLIGSKEIMEHKEFVMRDCIVDVGRPKKIRVKFLKLTTL